MSIFKTVRGWFLMLQKSRIKEEFAVEPIRAAAVDSWLRECADIYSGNPSWINVENGIDSICFAKAICSEVARLGTLGIGIDVTGGARAAWLKKQLDNIYFDLRHWLEYGAAFGTVVLKPNGDSIDLYTRDQYEITAVDNGHIVGMVFINQQKVDDKWFTRLEYHRFESDVYSITNKCYVGASQDDTRKPVAIEDSPWPELAEAVTIGNLDRPLFGVLKMPQANGIDPTSPYSLPVFSEAVQELRDLDIAYSRFVNEIQDSKRTVLLDSDLMFESGKRISALGMDARRQALGLPDMVKNVTGNGSESFYQEINPTLNTETRLAGINALLSQIGYKCGFSNGYFVFNQSSGIQTATQVEADQQRTMQLIKDVRDKLEDCLDGLIYALNAFADLYQLAPAGTYEVVYDFGDIAYSESEEKARWYSYVNAGRVPFWYYLVKFEGFTEEDAKELEQAARPKETLFTEEE